jgi:hypothetical protein
MVVGWIERDVLRVLDYNSVTNLHVQGKPLKRLLLD